MAAPVAGLYYFLDFLHRLALGTGEEMVRIGMAWATIPYRRLRHVPPREGLYYTDYWGCILFFLLQGRWPRALELGCEGRCLLYPGREKRGLEISGRNAQLRSTL
jgi:hypothetical protein